MVRTVCCQRAWSTSLCSQDPQAVISFWSRIWNETTAAFRARGGRCEGGCWAGELSSAGDGAAAKLCFKTKEKNKQALSLHGR